MAACYSYLKQLEQHRNFTNVLGKFDGHFEKHETLFYVSSERKYTEFLAMHRHIVVSGTDNIKQNKEQNTHGLTDKLPTNLKAMFLH